MTYKKFQLANNAKGQLEVGISAVATEVILKSWQWDLFKANNGTTDKTYLWTLVKFDTDGVTILKNEIVEVTAKTGDTFTIVRSYGTCPWSDASTTQWTTAYAFDADDYFFMNNVAEVIEDIQDELTAFEAQTAQDFQNVDDEKLDITEYQQWQYVYGATSAWSDAYAITLPNPPVAYTTGQVFRFQADVENTWSATLNVNAIGAITIKKLHDQDLETWDIEAWQIVVVAYDWTNFQMNSQVAIIPEAETSKLLEETQTAGEAWVAGNCLFLENPVEFADATSEELVWEASANTRVAIKAVWNWENAGAVNLALKKVWTPSTLRIRIETDNAWSPSWTLIDANAVGEVDPTALTTSLEDTEILLNWSPVEDDNGVTLDNTQADQTMYRWVKFKILNACAILTVTKNASCTATKAYLYDDTWSLLATATFSTNTATFNYNSLTVWSSYYLQAWSDWSAYTNANQTWSANFPYTWTNVEFETWITGIFWSDTTDWHTTNFTIHQYNETDDGGFKFLTKSALLLKSVTKHPSTTPTIVKLKDSGWTLIATATFVGNVATFSTPIQLADATTYRVEVNSEGAQYTDYIVAPFTPVNATNINWTGWSKNGLDSPHWYNVLSVTTSTGAEEDYVNNFEAIETNVTSSITKWTPVRVVIYQWTYWSETVDGSNHYAIWYKDIETTTRDWKLRNWSAFSSADNKFYYNISDMFFEALLSKTNSDYSYKVPSDLLRIATETFAIWDIPKVTVPWSITRSVAWLTANTDVFLSDTAGWVSTTPWTNKYLVGKVLPDGVNLRQNSKNLTSADQTPWTSPYTYQNTTWFPLIITITGWTVSDVSISRDWTNFFKVAGATSTQVTLQVDDYVKVTYSLVPTMTVFYQ